MLRNNTSRHRIAVLFMYLTIGITFLFSLYEIYAYQQISYAGDITSDEVADELIENTSLLMVGGLLGVLLVGIVLGTIITFIMWFRRAYYNLHQLYDGLSYSEGWAAGAWFVPFMNLVRPYKIMLELYNEAKIHLGEGEASERKQIGWWWAMYLISNVIDNVDSKIGQQFDFATILTIKSIALIATIASALLAVQVIQGYQKLEVRLYDLDSNDDEILTIGEELY